MLRIVDSCTRQSRSSCSSWSNCCLYPWALRNCSMRCTRPWDDFWNCSSSCWSPSSACGARCKLSAAAPVQHNEWNLSYCDTNSSANMSAARIGAQVLLQYFMPVPWTGLLPRRISAFTVCVAPIPAVSKASCVPQLVVMTSHSDLRSEIIVPIFMWKL
jgi:hypothetical protein